MTAPRKKTRNFGDFELLQRIGRDGPFHLFRARQISLDRLVTLKVLPERTATLERVALLRRELDAGSRLDHPFILRIYETGQVGGSPYLALAPIDGTQLAERLKSSALSPRLAIDIARQLAEALVHAHERGVLHGSLRPEVVWLARDGQARLSGFGCPVQFEALDTEALLGGVGYLAPEQAGGRGAVGRATDVYSLGALLYAMLTGVPPHQGATVAETCRLIRSQTPVRPTRLNPGLAPALDAICRKCLHVAPARRYGTERPCARFLADLRHVHSGRADEPDPSQMVLAWLRRHGRWLRSTALLVVLGLIPGCWDRQQHATAWERLLDPGAGIEHHRAALQHFERLAAHRPFDHESVAGVQLAQFRVNTSASGDSTRAFVVAGTLNEWVAVQNLTGIMISLRHGRKEDASTAWQTLRAKNYMPTTMQEQRLYDECQRLLGELSTPQR